MVSKNLFTKMNKIIFIKKVENVASIYTTNITIKTCWQFKHESFHLPPVITGNGTV